MVGPETYGALVDAHWRLGDRVLAHVQTALKGRRKTARAARGKPKKKPARKRSRR